MTRLELEFNDYCESNIHGSEYQLHIKVLSRWAQKEIADLRKWVNDLQSGMYINCVYCGHRYGPKDEVPASMADVLKKHIEKCPKHPMSALHKEVSRLKSIIDAGRRGMGIDELELCLKMANEETDMLRKAVEWALATGQDHLITEDGFSFSKWKAELRRKAKEG